MHSAEIRSQLRNRRVITNRICIVLRTILLAESVRPIQWSYVMNRRDALKLGATSVVVASVVPASAQDRLRRRLKSLEKRIDARKAPKMKMTTNIPASSRAGQGGNPHWDTQLLRRFPDKATGEKVYDNLDFQRGLQAYLAALPAVSIEGLRKGITGFALPTRPL